MLSKNILVDSSVIGTVKFYAYVFNDESGRVGFGLFPNDGSEPIVYLLNVQGSRIKIFFNERIILLICQQSRFSTNERRNFFREFLDFATSMEKKAARLVFRDNKMTYMADTREMIKYKRLYIHYKSPVSSKDDMKVVSN